MVPVLRCAVCEQQVLLPYRRFMNSRIVEPYSPDGDADLSWVCDACGSYTATARHEIEWIAGDHVPPLLLDRSFWRVDILCATPGCRSSVVAHTQTFGITSRRNLGLMIARASPTPTCAHGHPVLSEHSYPNRLDFIEWTGVEDYLT